MLKRMNKKIPAFIREQELKERRTRPNDHLWTTFFGLKIFIKLYFEKIHTIAIIS